MGAAGVLGRGALMRRGDAASVALDRGDRPCTRPDYRFLERRLNHNNHTKELQDHRFFQSNVQTDQTVNVLVGLHTHRDLLALLS